MLSSIIHALLISIAKSYSELLSARMCGINHTMSSRNDRRDKQLKYETIPLSKLRQGRFGKHHELVETILKQLQALPEEEAIKIPLDSVNGLSKANLRSAIVRAASSRAIHVSTYSDGNNFYVWCRTRGTARYERKRRT